MPQRQRQHIKPHQPRQHIKTSSMSSRSTNQTASSTSNLISRGSTSDHPQQIKPHPPRQKSNLTTRSTLKRSAHLTTAAADQTASSGSGSTSNLINRGSMSSRSTNQTASSTSNLISRGSTSDHPQHIKTFSTSHCITYLSTFLVPIEVFHLCQTSRMCHVNASHLAKRMMNASLTLSLDQALQRNKVGFRVADLKLLNSLIKERNLPSFSVALSGSIVLQACLGKPFGIKKTDADLFCSFEALHVVREWLVCTKKCNMVFHRVKERKCTSDLNSFLEKDIGGERVHHVEAYGPMPSAAQLNDRSKVDPSSAGRLISTTPSRSATLTGTSAMSS